ncbi:hypothetical protein N7539_000485 [Penicillium diatomitis]|uniref:Transcription factor RfeG n=1 Tax=Penicillium diatomitis TaxID=2819901 RepID=A0A9X0C2S6_9EURO|nr:uncharacterized protein N7539_000485 [Penicillium diatomitis]KAJ5495369.1 hypothetical protein N7539_000485 [Penicillium diatomitis]
MTGRQNEYFVPGDGINREVIQADICRYLGNDALVRPGNHSGRQGFFIRAYRNLTSEMIADLKADSARWEAEASRDAEAGHPRGSYIHYVKPSPAPNSVSANYATSAIHEVRQQQGPSPTTYNAAPAQPYLDPYSQSPYSAGQSAPYPAPAYTSSHSPYGQGQAPYPPPQVTYSGSQPPIVTTADTHPSLYTYTASGHNYSGYEGNSRNAPRYPGPGYDDSDYSPASSGIGYPASTSAVDVRMTSSMEPRYTPEYERSRPQPTREREPHRGRR